MYSNDRPLLARLLWRAIGVVCVCLGVIGLVMPLLPGIPLLIVGILLLRRRGRPGAERTTDATGLSAFEKIQVQCWLAARRITMSAESARLTRRTRQRGY
jgi:hypothetical protein